MNAIKGPQLNKFVVDILEGTGDWMAHFVEPADRVESMRLPEGLNDRVCHDNCSLSHRSFQLFKDGTYESRIHVKMESPAVSDQFESALTVCLPTDLVTSSTTGWL
jgi:hypothetical protein